MKKMVRSLTLVLCLALFAGMAMGSGSDSKDKESTKTTDKVEVSDSKVDETEIEESVTETETTTEATEANVVEWEIGETEVKTWKDSINVGHVAVMVPVVNTGNTNLYLSAGTIEIVDSNNALVDSISLVSVYPQVLAPGETAYYYDTRLFDFDTDVEYGCVPHVDIEEASVDLIRYEVSDVTFSEDTFSDISAVGRIANSTEEDESMPYVAIIPKDADGKPLCVLMSIPDKVKAGDTMSFSATALSLPDDITLDMIDSFEAYSYPHQFQF